MDKDKLLTTLAQHLTDNIGNRLTQALANGLLLELDRAIEQQRPPADVAPTSEE